LGRLCELRILVACKMTPCHVMWALLAFLMGCKQAGAALPVALKTSRSNIMLISISNYCRPEVHVMNSEGDSGWPVLLL
jgi:hypothetical protein